MRDEPPFIKFMEFKINKYNVSNVTCSLLAKKPMSFKGLSERLTYILFIRKHRLSPFADFYGAQILFTSLFNLLGGFSVFLRISFTYGILLL